MFGRVFVWEFLGGKRLYMILLLYFLILFSSGVFAAGLVDVEIETSRGRSLTPGSLIDIYQPPSDLWWFSFPVITAYAVLMFSYESDKGIIRTYLLSCTRKSTLFGAKLLAIFIGVFVPLISSLLIVYPIADPVIFYANPLEVYVNLPRRLLLYALILYTMTGFSVLSAVAFKRPLYGFAVPIAITYTLNNVSLSVIGGYIPPRCYLMLTNPIGLVPLGTFLGKMSMALPAFIASTIALIASYVIFVKRDVV